MSPWCQFGFANTVPKCMNWRCPIPWLVWSSGHPIYLPPHPGFCWVAFQLVRLTATQLFIHNFGLAIRSWILNILSMNIIPQPSGGDAFLLPFTGMKEEEKERSQYSSHRTKWLLVWMELKPQTCLGVWAKFISFCNTYLYIINIYMYINYIYIYMYISNFYLYLVTYKLCRIMTDRYDSFCGAFG